MHTITRKTSFTINTTLNLFPPGEPRWESYRKKSPQAEIPPKKIPNANISSVQCTNLKLEKTTIL